MSIDKPWLNTAAAAGVPIAVYQMGKVGSRTIINSLENLQLPDSVHHLHMLSHIVMSRDSGDSVQIRNSRVIREYLDSAADQPLRIITGVREPIAQSISSLFQNLKSLRPDLIADDGSWDETGVLSFVADELRNFDPVTDWFASWFDHDFEPAIGINVYDNPFDHEAGHVKITKGNLSVLILRLENSSTWAETITEFLGLDELLQLKSANTAANKTYDAVYRSVKSNLNLDEETVDRFYGTKQCRHFYSAEMILEFRTCLLYTSPSPRDRG